MVQTEQMPLEQMVFTGTWELLRQAYDMKDIDENWDLLLEKAEMFQARFADTFVSGLSADLLTSVMRHIEAVKGMEKKGGASHAEHYPMGR